MPRQGALWYNWHESGLIRGFVKRHMNSLIRLAIAGVLLSGLFATDPVRLPTAAAAPVGAACTWDQSSGAYADRYVSSSDFEEQLNSFDAKAADDFEIGSGLVCDITTVTVVGQYDGPSQPSAPPSVRVGFYANAANNLPGVLLAQQVVLSPSISGLLTGVLGITLNTPVKLSTGRFWLSVQAVNPDWLTTSRQWVWREASGASLSESAWQQPGNGYFSNCLIWRPRVTSCRQPTNSLSTDLAFKVEGPTSSDNPVPVLILLSPDARAPGSSGFTLQLDGANFVAGSTVLWNSTTLTPTTNTGSTLTVNVPGSLLATSGVAIVKVHNPTPGGGDSNSLPFYLQGRLFVPLIHR